MLKGIKRGNWKKKKECEEGEKECREEKKKKIPSKTASGS
jgi:hypothetical protein